MTKNFKKSEFACQCGCGLDAIDPKLVNMLQAVRDKCGFALTVNSGCRCKEHNRRVGGKLDSAHLPNPDTGLCEAADIRMPSGVNMYHFLRACFEAGIQRIGINFTSQFVHVDTDLTKPHPTVFKY